MYSPSLPAGYTEMFDHHEFGEHGKYISSIIYQNVPPMERGSGFDSSEYADDLGLGLYFDYRPLAYYFEIGKLTIGFPYVSQ